MRILYFSRDYGSFTTTFIRNQVEYFVANHECVYLCQQSLLQGTPPGFLRVVPFKENIIRKVLWKSGFMAYFYSKKYSKQVKQIVEDFNPDIIHCHFAAEALMLIDNINYHKYQILIHFHGYDASQAIRKPAFVKRLKSLLNQPNIIPISCNQYFTNRLSALLTIPANKFLVLKYGINITLFDRKENDSAKKTKTFLQISSFSPKKGHEYTLRSFSIFLNNTNHKDCILVLAGDGKEKRRAEKLANELGIRNRVRFPGAITPAEVVKLLQQADVFVHHSITAPDGDMEGIPNSLIEAMAMKLPVISTDHSGIPELIEDKINGYLVKEKNVIDYAHKMQMALEMDLREVNREKVNEYFEINKQNKKLEKMYEQIQIVAL